MSGEVHNEPINAGEQETQENGGSDAAAGRHSPAGHWASHRKNWEKHVLSRKQGGRDSLHSHEVSEKEFGDWEGTKEGQKQVIWALKATPRSLGFP